MNYPHALAIVSSARSDGRESLRHRRKVGIFWVTGLLASLAVAVGGCTGSYNSKRFLEKSDEEKRAVLHKCLQRGDIHDPAIMLAWLGDESSVPYLIDALEGFSPIKDKSAPIICVQEHCVEALRAITNHDVGLDYADWARWWEENKDKQREEWVADGFRKKGLPVAAPPNEVYVCALVREMADEGTFGAGNAWRILEDLPSDWLQLQVNMCSRSDDPADRLGAIAALSRIETDSAGARLAEMIKDPEAIVRESALAKTNEYLRRRPSISSDEQVLWKGSLGREIMVVAPGADENHVFVGYEAKARIGEDSHLASFNLTTKEQEWSCSCSGAVNSMPVVEKDRAYFCCDDGAVYCVAMDGGRVVWRKQTEGHPGSRPVNKIILVDGAVVTTMSAFLYAFNQDTGDVLWQLQESPRIGEIEFMSGRIYTASKEDGLLRVSPDGVVLFRKQGESVRLFSSRDGVLFATIGEHPSSLVALSGESLETLWQHDIGSHWEVTLVQSEDCLLVGLRNSRYLGVERATGEILWSVPGRDCSPMGAFGNRFAATGGRYQVELRNTASGQVSARYDKPAVYPGHAMYMTRDFIVTGAMRAFAERDGHNLWILNAPNVVRP